MSKKHLRRYPAKKLEELAKRDIAGLTTEQRYRVRKRLRKTIDVALSTGMPDRAEWCEVLLKKFAPKGDPA